MRINAYNRIDNTYLCVYNQAIRMMEVCNMPMTSKEMVKLLERNGFTKVRQKGSHWFFVNKETNRRTTVPMHAKDLPLGTEQTILKQAGLK